MPETLPVTRVESVTAAVMECAGPPIVIDVPLTAVTLPIMKIIAVPRGPARGSAPFPPGWPLPPGGTGASCDGCPPGAAVVAEGELDRSTTPSTIPAPAAAAASAITASVPGRTRRLSAPWPGTPAGLTAAGHGSPAPPPPADPPLRPAGSSSSGHKSSGHSSPPASSPGPDSPGHPAPPGSPGHRPPPNPLDAEDRCDIDPSPASHAHRRWTGHAPAGCPARSRLPRPRLHPGYSTRPVPRPVQERAMAH